MAGTSLEPGIKDHTHQNQAKHYTQLEWKEEREKEPITQYQFPISLPTQLSPLSNTTLLNIITGIRFPLQTNFLLGKSAVDFLNGNKFFNLHDLTGDGRRHAVEDDAHALLQAEGLENVC
jgi:hypothetical protein